MKKISKQRKLTLVLLSFALMVAVYLNWEYSQGAQGHYITAETMETQGEVSEINEGDLLLTMDDYEAENYGDAQLVATNKTDIEKYFEETRLAREKTRDEALDTLEQTLKSANLSDSEKTQATESLAKIVQDMTLETDIENMVKAKGFTDCVATIAGEKITLAVAPTSGTLTAQDVVKVRDVVLSKTDILAQNIVVIEVK